MRPSLNRVLEWMETRVWLVPSLCLTASMGLSFTIGTIDERLAEDRSAWFLFRGGPEGARAVLSEIASSVMALTGVVFSVTMLVLQLASNQFSPRVLRNFLQDRVSQGVLGIFVGTFLFALLGLRSVRGGADSISPHVPALTVWVAVLLAGGCVVGFTYFIHHVAQSIRAVNVLRRIGDEARKRLPSLYPESVGTGDPRGDAAGPGGPLSLLIPLPGPAGVVKLVDEQALWRAATRAGVTLRLVPMMGDFVPSGGPLFEVWGDVTHLDAERLTDAIVIGNERSVRQDIAFAFRELVDVAERALSPGINDPTTAVQALDQLHDLLRLLVRRDYPAPCRFDETGALRLMLPRPAWDDHLRLAIEEIRLLGAGQLQISRRLRFLLEDLLTIAPPARRGELEHQLSLLRASVVRGFPSRDERASAEAASPQGNGPQPE